MHGATARSDAAANRSRRILGSRIDALTFEGAIERVLAWAERRESRYVCFSTVNNVMTGYFDPEFRRVSNAADLVTNRLVMVENGVGFYFV